MDEKKLRSGRFHRQGLDGRLRGRSAPEVLSAEDFLNLELEDREEIFYWRKHPNLHGSMEALYRSKRRHGGEL